MPRSDAIPLGQSSTPQAQQSAATPTGRAAAQPLNQPSAPITAAPQPADASSNAQSSGYGVLDYLHSASQGLDAATRAATDWPTFGLVDKLFGKQAQADTAAAHKQMGAWDLPLSIAGSAVTGGPELQAASKIGGAIAPTLSKLPLTGTGKWLGGVLGTGAVGAPISGLGEYGHEAGWTPDPSAIGKASAIGGALNAGAGMLGGVVGRGGQLAPATSAADLKTQAQQAYAPLSNILYDASSEVHPRIDPIDAQNALRDWSGYKWGDASKTSKEVQTLLDKPQLSANDIQQSQSYLKSIARNPNSDPNDALYASHYVGKLQDVLENGTPQTGVPAGAGPGYAAQVKAEGDVLHGQASDVDRLNDWIAKSQVAGGPDVGSQAGSYLRTQQGQRFAPPGSPGYDALNTLAGTAQGPLGGGQGITLWDLKHHLLWPAVGLAGAQTAGAFGTAEGHQPWWANIPEDLGGIAAGVLMKKGFNAAGVAAQRRAIEAAQTALSTGQQQSPIQALTPLRNAIRQAIYGPGAGGNY